LEIVSKFFRYFKNSSHFKESSHNDKNVSDLSDFIGNNSKKLYIVKSFLKSICINNRIDTINMKEIVGLSAKIDPSTDYFTKVSDNINYIIETCCYLCALDIVNSHIYEGPKLLTFFPSFAVRHRYAHFFSLMAPP